MRRQSECKCSADLKCLMQRFTAFNIGFAIQFYMSASYQSRTCKGIFNQKLRASCVHHSLRAGLYTNLKYHRMYYALHSALHSSAGILPDTDQSSWLPSICTHSCPNKAILGKMSWSGGIQGIQGKFYLQASRSPPRSLMQSAKVLACRLQGSSGSRANC